MGAKRIRPRGARQLWLVPTQGQSEHQLVADVALDALAAETLCYAIPDALRDRVRPGARLHVPYGPRSRSVPALCLRVTEQPWDHTRWPILDADAGPVWLSTPLVELGLWVADYYLCSPGKAFGAILPAAIRKPGATRVARGRATAAPPASATAPAPSAEDAYDLTPGQRAACLALTTARPESSGFHVFVLFGVPGSGKTEVYVRAMRDVIARGRQAILLIPEIALTTQVVDRLVRRFARVATFHSRLSAGARCRTLTAIAAGDVDVVIGTRSAVFAPCPRLGLIVVDEEQETSFKNLAAPFYHARDVAIKRGQLEGIPVVLGSATPALETWHNATHLSHYELLHLPQRVPQAQVPRVQRVEHGRPELETATGLLSAELRAQLTRVLADRQQAILLYNRRGYAPYLRCAACGLTLRCERCGCHHVYHQAEDILKCHRCGGRSAVPTHCLDDTCRGTLQRTGSAIQRLEEEVRAAFAQARLLRLDSDTMKRRADYRVALQRFEAGEADILLGTQMVAKGLDFPCVQLVGVIDADAALALPDFRAAERVFQLIVQVVGRAGRRAGESLAIVQTRTRPAPVVHHALRMDYETFAAEELAARARLFYPPASRLVRLILADPRPQRAHEEAVRLADGLRERAGRLHAQVRVHAPEPCIIRQLRGLLRYQVLVRGPRGLGLGPLLREAARGQPLAPRVQRLTIDVDPVDLF